MKTKKAEDLGAAALADVFKAIHETNPYRWRTALRILRERKDNPKFISDIGDAAIPLLKSKPDTSHIPYHGALFFDIVYPIAENSPKRTEPPEEELKHRDERAITFFLRGYRDATAPIEGFQETLIGYAKVCNSVSVRREIASLAITMRDRQANDTLLHEMLKRKEDATDPIIPTLLWIAYEKNTVTHTSAELDWIIDNSPSNPLITDYIIPRAMRRLIATGKPEHLAACIKFVGDLKDPTAKQRALEGLVVALQNRQVDAPAEWKTVRIALAKESSKEIKALANKLAINFRDVEAIQAALVVVTDDKAPVMDRVGAIRDLASAKPSAALAPLQKLAVSDAPIELRIEAIRALASFNDPSVPKQLIALWEKYPLALKGEVINVLAGRKDWAKELLDAVATKKVASTELNINAIERIQALKDKALNAQIDKVWGRLRTTPAELTELINKTRAQLNATPASFARGKIAFDNHCAKCHKFDGRGSEVGPSIEGAARDIEYLLVNVLDPNRVIGAPYFIRTVTKLNGQNEIGILAAEDENSITLKTENAVLKTIQKKDVEEIRIQEKSLMPEGFGSNIKIEEFRDLIRYTMANPFITDVAVFVWLNEKEGIKKRRRRALPGTSPFPFRAKRNMTSLSKACSHRPTR